MNKPSSIAIDLGCGRSKRPGSFGVDLVPLAGVDLVADFGERLPLAGSSIDLIHCNHVLEHFENPIPLLAEIHRVLKPQGQAKIAVPHWSNPYYYSDITHRSLWGYYSFDYLEPQALQKSLVRKVPDYYVDFHFEIVQKEMVFWELYDMKRRHWRSLQRWLNARPSNQEFYERHLAAIVGCSELRVTLRPLK